MSHLASAGFKRAARSPLLVAISYSSKHYYPDRQQPYMQGRHFYVTRSGLRVVSAMCEVDSVSWFQTNDYAGIREIP